MLSVHNKFEKILNKFRWGALIIQKNRMVTRVWIFSCTWSAARLQTTPAALQVSGPRVHPHSWRFGCRGSEPVQAVTFLQWPGTEASQSAEQGRPQPEQGCPQQQLSGWASAIWPPPELHLQPYHSPACAWPWALVIWTLTHGLTSQPGRSPAAPLWTSLVMDGLCLTPGTVAGLILLPCRGGQWDGPWLERPLSCWPRCPPWCPALWQRGGFKQWNEVAAY